MPTQEYISLFQNLFQQYYAFTLENSGYAIFLGVSVWLLTAILYSFSISSLNKKIRNLKTANQETQASLASAYEQIQSLQTENGTIQWQLTEENTQRLALNEQIKDISQQLTSAIIGLTKEAKLGQQGLTAPEGLSVEHLWQRYSVAVKQISEQLLNQIGSNDELRNIIKQDAAKIAEKDLHVQAAQTRLDSLKQQIVKLEVSLQEQQSQLTQERVSAEQRYLELQEKHQADLAQLAVIEAKHQADHVRLTQLEQQSLAAKQSKSVTATVSQAIPTESVPVIPVKPEVVVPEIKQAAPTQVVEAVRPVLEPEVPKQQPEKPISTTTSLETSPLPITELKTTEHDHQPEASGFGGKFKSLLSNAKRKIDKLDEKLGQRTPLPAETEEPEFLKEEEPAPVIVSEPIVKTVSEPVIENTVSAEPKRSNPLKKFFSGNKAKTEEVIVEIEPANAVQEVVTAPEAEVAPNKEGLGNKFKKLFGKNKAPIEAVPEVIVPVIVEIPEPEPIKEEGATGQVKALFAKFKKK